MCGICGEIARGGAAPSEEAVRRMMDVMRPRGPDADGTHGTAGVMLGDGRLLLLVKPHLALLPAAVIFVLVAGLNLAGDGLRDALDPRMQFKPRNGG
jgi:hypothetical protein